MPEEQEAIEQVGEAFQKLGATDKQALVMAEQLVKRAIQLQKQNQTSLIEELGKLLKTVSYGAQGQLNPKIKPDFRKKHRKTAEKWGF